MPTFDPIASGARAAWISRCGRPATTPRTAPRLDDPCWLPEIECAPPAARDALILAKLREQVRYAWERSPFYRAKWEAAGVSPDTLRDPRRSRRLPGGAEGRAARGAGRASAIRRLPRDRARRGGAHPRHERHHGPAHRVRRGGGRLDAHRRGARPHPVGRGHSPGRSRHDLLLLQPVHGLVGRARGRGASGRDGVSLRRRGGGTDPGRGAVGARAQAHRFLRHAVLRAALRGDGAARWRRSAQPRLADPVLLGRAGRGHPRHQAPDRGDVRRNLRRHGQHGRDDARG